MTQQQIGSSGIVAALAALCCFACTESISEKSDSSEHEIVGGTVAAQGAWPGATALYRDLGKYDGNVRVCGGTLVAPTWVVSAGHCVAIPSYPNGGITTIVVGRNKMTGTGGETINVKKYYRHAGFNASTYVNDIALFELETPSTMPIARLVNPEQATAAVVPTAMTTVVGWGATSENGESSDDLLQVDVPIIDNATCKAFPRYENVDEGMLCAGYPAGGKDSCQGDSGGPLFMKINDEIVQVGLTSWGLGCARANAPGVYTRTSAHLGWLWTTTGGAVGLPPAG